MERINKRRVLNVIRHINKVIRKQGVYSCVLTEFYDSSLRKITKSAPAWYDTTLHNDRILALRFLRSKGYVVSVQPQWANSPSYFKGELFYMNMTGISIRKYEQRNKIQSERLADKYPLKKRHTISRFVTYKLKHEKS